MRSLGNMTPLSNKVRPASGALTAPPATPPEGNSCGGFGGKYRISPNNGAGMPVSSHFQPIAYLGGITFRLGFGIHEMERGNPNGGLDSILA
jgi:hypothetical protein